MGRREEISKELDELAIEIEKDALLARGRQAAKIALAPETHIRLEFVIGQHAPTSVQICISTEPADDGAPA
ncbi:hypothetical protein B0G76_1715 [Paraburkholderia sp. BL23I1N1]|uniref:hypothetical protein n=1 Tax=unclassified Paraburkholderia TaxID=2615204 RepID=UPI000B0AE99C|nr:MULTISPECIES: hypothetical protein [unclassified Paraburkholderia]REE18589.1 hypothetical protein B0G71_1643 [Paraburkholderia sp. BL27I4N3]RKE35603.1 hypothetical protein B0G76_1715 [Paraburkholderia sp. BL23I1N1]TCK94668.1 hypothetical protein B0G74_1259 [Paraburkholderia sp. BL9I2N2]